MISHNFSKKIKGIYYCSSCGLVQLNNDFTRWCIQKGCEYDIHPQYYAARIKYTGRK